MARLRGRTASYNESIHDTIINSPPRPKGTRGLNVIFREVNSIATRNNNLSCGNTIY